MRLNNLCIATALLFAAEMSPLQAGEPLDLNSFMTPSPTYYQPRVRDYPPALRFQPVSSGQSVQNPWSRSVVDAGISKGIIIIDASSHWLYLGLGNNKAIRYGVGVGREGMKWQGTEVVSAKREWPSWTPPADMLERQPYLPRFMAGGPENPLGARALYLGSSLYRIHGTNDPTTIGKDVSSGCIRLTNEDVIDLYDRVPVGTQVYVMR